MEALCRRASSKTVHVLVREMTFRDLASVRFQILVVAEPRGNVIGHVQEFQLIHGQAHERVVSFDDEKLSDTVLIFLFRVGTFF